ncbi:MAG: PEGA domain-containing protein [Deltaproteobacteria bacterium]|nr:PEGA domain-containing protein [Deltaproteobacteria bacterium]
MARSDGKGPIDVDGSDFGKRADAVDLPEDTGGVKLTTKAEELMDSGAEQRADPWGGERSKKTRRSVTPPPVIASLDDPTAPTAPADPKPPSSKGMKQALRQQPRPAAPPSKGRAIGILLFVVAAVAVVFVADRFASEAPPPRGSPTATARAAEGSLSVESEPPGATVTIDGASAGLVTPATIKLPTDKPVRVAVSLEGFAAQPTERVLAVPGDLGRAVARFSLVPGRSMRIESSPSEAEVTVDGTQIKGVTPFTLPAFPIKQKVALTVARDGYRTIHREIVVQEKGDPSVKLTLELSRTLDITSSPGGATVSINGEVLGTTPIDGATVPVKEFTMVLEKTGFERLEQLVSASEDTRRAHADLIPLPLSNQALSPELKVKVKKLETTLRQYDKELTSAKSKLTRAEEFQGRLSPESTEAESEKADRGVEEARKEVDRITAEFEKIRGELDDIRASVAAQATP